MMSLLLKKMVSNYFLQLEMIYEKVTLHHIYMFICHYLNRPTSWICMSITQRECTQRECMSQEMYELYPPASLITCKQFTRLLL